jgi:glycosyltransferase involved in cell wall biosynthesis
MKQLAVFIPAFNEAETLWSLASNVPARILGCETTIVIADDYSNDGTASIAKELTPHVVCLPKNSGAGATTKAGLLYIIGLGINFDYLAKLDGDGQHNLDLLPQLVDKLLKGSDLVIMSRFHPLSNQMHTPWDRILLNTIFSQMVSKITGWELTDVRSGYMGFNFEIIRQIAPQMIIERYGYPMELILRTWHYRPNSVVAEIPHPALYGGHISEKLIQKYALEQINQKATRLDEAFAAALQIIEDLNIPREDILQRNGYHNF